MTATQIFEHPRYQDSQFSFEGEKWTKMHIPGFSRYVISNFYRIKNSHTSHILKPRSRRDSYKLVISLYSDDKKAVKFNMEKIFGKFEVMTEKQKRGTNEFIYNAF